MFGKSGRTSKTIGTGNSLLATLYQRYPTIVSFLSAAITFEQELETFFQD